MEPTNFDYIYAALGVIIGLVLIKSPRIVMRGAKYDEEGMKTESLVKKMGIGLIVMAIGLAIYLYVR